MNRNKIITVVFLISIGLNLFFLGMLVSRRLFHTDGTTRAGGPHGRGGPRLESAGPMRIVGDVVSVMGGRKDPRVSAAWQTRREHLKTQGKNLHKTHERLTTALSTTPYSESQLNEVLSALNEDTLTAQKDAQQLLVQLAAQLTDQERKHLGQVLEKRGDMTRKLR